MSGYVSRLSIAVCEGVKKRQQLPRITHPVEVRARVTDILKKVSNSSPVSFRKKSIRKTLVTGLGNQEDNGAFFDQIISRYECVFSPFGEPS